MRVRYARKHGLMFAAAIALSVLVQAHGRSEIPAANAQTDASTNLNFRISFVPGAEVAPFYVAAARYWPKLGLRGTVLPGKGAASTVQSTGAGTDQMALVDFASAVNGIQLGIPITIIAAPEGRDPSGVIFTAASGIRNWADLKGRRVGFLPGAVSVLMVRAALKRQGIDPDAVDWQTIPPGAQLALLKAGTLQAATGYAGAQDVQLACEGVSAHSLRAYDAGIKSMGQVIIVNTDWAKKVGDDAVAKALLGIFQGFAFTKSNPAAAVRNMAKLSPNDQIEANMTAILSLFDEKRASIPWMLQPLDRTRKFGWLDADHVTGAIATLTSAGVLKSSDGAATTTAYYTTKYLENRDVQAAASEVDRQKWAPVASNVRQLCGFR